MLSILRCCRAMTLTVTTLTLMYVVDLVEVYHRLNFCGPAELGFRDNRGQRFNFDLDYLKVKVKLKVKVRCVRQVLVRTTSRSNVNGLTVTVAEKIATF